MKRILTVLCVLALLFTGALAEPAQTTETTDTTETTEATEAAQPANDASWSDFVVTLDGETYTLPLGIDVLTAAGWAFDDEEMVLEPNQYSMEQIKKDGEKATAYVINLGIDDKALKDCLVGGFQFDTYAMEAGAQLELAGGVQMGALMDDVRAIYGDPSDIYEGSYYTSLTWSQDSYEEVELSFSVENDALEEIVIRNFAEPEGYNDAAYAAEVSVPECVTAYQAPAELGTDPLSFNFQLGDVVYTMPVPASVLAENGWALNGSLLNAKLAAHDSDFGWKLTNNAQSLESVGINNDSATANTAENSMVIQLTERSSATSNLTLPGGITINTTMEELEAALADVPYEKEDGSFIYYTLTKDDDSFRTITFIYNSEDGKMSAIEISYWPD